MPGIATQFVVLERSIARLSSSADADLRTIAQTMRDHPQYAYLGAIGPTLADFIPSDPLPPGTLGGNQYLNIWKQVFGVVGDDMVVAMGLTSVLKRMIGFLDKLEPIAAAEDTDALKAMADELDVITQTADALKNIVNQIPLLAVIIGSGIGVGMKPPLCAPVGSAVPPWELWKVREVLFWKKTGAFAEALVNRARASADPRFLAYAYGYLTSYSANVVGSPFVNSIIGGPYRSQWWRHRWIGNYVDAWVYGAYGIGATMNGDTPSPLYNEWPNLCDASLQDRIAMGPIDPQDIMRRIWNGDPFPSVLPDDFGQFWFSAFTDAYGVPPLGYPVTAASLNGAYLMTWMVLWFQTSGEVLGCNPTPPLNPPDNCGAAPSWSDPTVPGDSGSGSTPPSPEIEIDGDTGAIVSGAILAILGAVLLFTPAWPLGATAIADGAVLIIEGWPEANWSKLRCDLYWYRMYLYNGLNALHEIMTLGAIAHPYARELADDETVLSLLGTEIRFDSGKATVQSRLARGFPAACWDGAISTWTQRPDSVELPPNIGYLSTAYPSFFVDDDAANPLANGDVKTGPAVWPIRLAPGGGVPVQFGNSVANAVDLFQQIGSALPNWNLDGDRGLAHLTWQFENGVVSDPVEIEPES
jgi:hypothetical protein